MSSESKAKTSRRSRSGPCSSADDLPADPGVDLPGHRGLQGARVWGCIASPPPSPLHLQPLLGGNNGCRGTEVCGDFCKASGELLAAKPWENCQEEKPQAHRPAPCPAGPRKPRHDPRHCPDRASGPPHGNPSKLRARVGRKVPPGRNAVLAGVVES